MWSILGSAREMKRRSARGWWGDTPPYQTPTVPAVCMCMRIFFDLILPCKLPIHSFTFAMFSQSTAPYLAGRGNLWWERAIQYNRGGVLPRRSYFARSLFIALENLSSNNVWNQQRTTSFPYAAVEFSAQLSSRGFLARWSCLPICKQLRKHVSLQTYHRDMQKA